MLTVGNKDPISINPLIDAMCEKCSSGKSTIQRVEWVKIEKGLKTKFQVHLMKTYN